MTAGRLTAHLMGGLGNQMFQYAAARALARRNGVQLFVDPRTGFARDRTYKRTYELDALPIQASLPGALRRLPFLLETARGKFVGRPVAAIVDRSYGTFISETEQRFMPEVATHDIRRETWIRGYWQSERYFSHEASTIAAELAPPASTDPRFIECSVRMNRSNSVAVGVRLFEEVPGASKSGVGGLTPMSFYNEAAAHLAATIDSPEFFVFCTTNSPQLRELDFPGRMHILTQDNGFSDSIASLWLLSQCRHHIIANSSFYWWGAWLAESRRPETHVVASPHFTNRDTIPARWSILHA